MAAQRADVSTPPCPADGNPCEVVAAFIDGIDRAEDIETVNRYLPCSRCRALERDAAALAGVRLGRLERRVLLLAPAPDAASIVVPPEADTRAAAEAQRRAMRKLEAVGLVWLGWKGNGVMANRSWREWGVPDDGPERWQLVERSGPVKTTVYRRSVRLSPLGLELVRLARPALEANRALRWQRIMPQLMRARWDLPTLLNDLGERLAYVRRAVLEMGKLAYRINHLAAAEAHLQEAQSLNRLTGVIKRCAVGGCSAKRPEASAGQ